MAHRPDCQELEDVVKTELQARPWCRKRTLPGRQMAYFDVLQPGGFNG